MIGFWYLDIFNNSISHPLLPPLLWTSRVNCMIGVFVIITAFFSPPVAARRYFGRGDNTGRTRSRAFFWSSTPSIRSRTTPATGRPTACTGTNIGRWQQSAGVSHRCAWQRTRPKTQPFPAVVAGCLWTWPTIFWHFPGTCDVV